MRIFTRKKLREFWERHPDAEAPLNDWYKVVEQADWARPLDVRDTYRRADPVGDEFVVFDICNNVYRLVVCVDYKRRKVYIWDVLTHRQYDRLDLEALAQQRKRERKEQEAARGETDQE